MRIVRHDFWMISHGIFDKSSGDIFDSVLVDVVIIIIFVVSCHSIECGYSNCSVTVYKGCPVYFGLFNVFVII